MKARFERWLWWHFGGGKQWFRSLTPEQKKAELLRTWEMARVELDSVPASREYQETLETMDSLIRKASFGGKA
jgi:hypothetical protein